MSLLVVVALSLTVSILVLLTNGPARIILGLPFVLFFPGYTLISALFPRKGDLEGIERLALSFGLSIAVVPLIGLALNYTPWGIRLYPILISLLLFITVMAAIGWYRQRRLPAEQRFETQFRSHVFPLSRFWVPQSRWDKALTILLVIAIVGAIGTLAYVIAKPKAGERFTEFYILGPDGKAQDYPTQLASGEKAKVIVGIVNREGDITRYRFEARRDEVVLVRVDDISLGNEQKWEREVEFALAGSQGKQKVDFWLYREGGQPYRTLHLWVDVK